jgi:hypothetical protein
MDSGFLEVGNRASFLRTWKGVNTLLSQYSAAENEFGSEGASPAGYMDPRNGISRRLFVLGGTNLGIARAMAQPKNENVYSFATPECDVRMTVEFYDRYSSDGFWFDERRTDRHYCLSAKGEESRDCLANFSGSLAVARYHIRPRPKALHLTVLREHVRTIDQDDRLKTQAPFDRVIELRQGIASDIQAFGYEVEASPARVRPPERYGPWCLLRQDLYFDGQTSPFLVVHWKHALSAIRILDLIPGDQTRAVGEYKAKE